MQQQSYQALTTDSHEYASLTQPPVVVTMSKSQLTNQSSSMSAGLMACGIFGGSGGAAIGGLYIGGIPAALGGFVIGTTVGACVGLTKEVCCNNPRP